MKLISTLISAAAATTFNGHLFSLAVNETAFVPANFALSFDITPFEIIFNTASIIRFSKDRTNLGAGGRIPGMSWTNI